MEGSSQRHILKANQCAGCGYDLRAHPATGSCPECGWRFDESIILLPGWSLDSSEQSRWKSVQVIKIAVVLAVGFAIVGLLSMFSMMLLLLTAAGVEIAVQLAPRGRGEPDLRLMFDRDHLRFGRPGQGRWRSRRWRQLRALRARRSGQRWRIEFAVRWPYRAYRESPRFLVCLSGDDLRAIQAEVDRRISSARERPSG